MKQFHHITLRVFVKEYEGDVPAELEQCVIDLVPFDLKEQKLKLNKTKATRHDKKTPIEIVELRLEKKRHVVAFLDHLFEKLGKEQLQEIANNPYVDEESYFFIRLYKPALEEGRYEVTTSGDCVHIRFLIAAYPANKKNAEKIIKEVLKNYF